MAIADGPQSPLPDQDAHDEERRLCHRVMRWAAGGATSSLDDVLMSDARTPVGIPVSMLRELARASAALGVQSPLE